MIGDSEDANVSWVMVLFRKFGSILKYVAKTVWDYVEHY